MVLGNPCSRHRQDAAILHLGCATTAASPLLSFDTQQGNDTSATAPSPLPAPRDTTATVDGLLSLPAWLLVMFNICLGILTEAQDKDQLNKQQK